MFRLLPLLADLALIALATALSQFTVLNFEFTDYNFRIVPYGIATLIVSVGILAFSGVSRAIWRFSSFADYARLIVATLAIVVCSLGLGFAVNRLDGVARSLPFIQLMLILLLLLFARNFARQRYLARQKRAAGAKGPLHDDHENYLVIGMGNLAELYLRFVAEERRQTIRVAGILQSRDYQVGRTVQGVKVIGLTADLHTVLSELRVHGVFIDRVVVAQNYESLTSAEQTALALLESEETIPLHYLVERLDLTQASAVRPAAQRANPDNDGSGRFSMANDEPGFVSRQPYFAVKRWLDGLGALALLVLLSPVIVLVGLAVAIDIGPPVIFWQQRTGLNGVPFRLYKFRTMRATRNHLGNLLPDEARTSRLGTMLRRFRLDELPQLFNVLMGEMSFIGPRPLLPVDQVPSAMRARHLVRPGLTGWAQVMGGREISALDKAALDIWYLRNASLALDWQIALATLRMVTIGERLDTIVVEQTWTELRSAGIYIDLT